MSVLISNALLSWEDYLGYGKRLFYKESSVIFEQGEVGEGFYYIKDGLIKIISTRKIKMRE